MLSSTLDVQSVPGVDVACNAMYLSLVGEVPELYCPPGCTLHATTQGIIYVLDHVRRIGYPLQLPSSTATPVPTAPPTLPLAPTAQVPLPMPVPVPVSVPPPPPQVPAAPAATSLPPPVTSANAPLQPVAAVPEPVVELGAISLYKRSRASSVDSRATPSSSHRAWERRPSSPHSSTDPTAPHGDDGGDDGHGGSGDDEDDRTSQRSAARLPPAAHMSLKKSPQYCLIPPRLRWLEDVYFTLQLGGQWVRNPGVLFYCHYCHVYFAATPSGIWHHLSNPKGHRVQRQRVRGYMVSGNHLLNTPEKRLLRVTSPEEIRSVPSKHFQTTDRLQKRDLLQFVPACVRYRSLMTPEQRERVVRDGAGFAADTIRHENLTGNTPQSFANEPPQLVGWRFLMEGLDIVHCYCHKTNSRLLEYTILSHHKKDK